MWVTDVVEADQENCVSALLTFGSSPSRHAIRTHAFSLALTASKEE